MVCIAGYFLNVSFNFKRDAGMENITLKARIALFGPILRMDETR